MADIEDISVAALRNANHIANCGNESAFALCSSVTACNPQRWVATLYADSRFDTWPNLNTLPLVREYCFVVLGFVTVSQLWRRRWSTSSAVIPKSPSAGFLSDHPNPYYRACSHWTALVAALCGFVFGAVYYQGGLLYQLARMDLFEWRGCIFGQIAAVTVWVPFIVEDSCGALRDRWRSRRLYEPVSGGIGT